MTQETSIQTIDNQLPADPMIGLIERIALFLKILNNEVKLLSRVIIHRFLINHASLQR